eukprot:TRINITY_DN1814_c1_g2_i1.p1 TRINITY_DN1814_c1_g2~~TRINITY_DN1814_c1_g2_i1.p1  ORF type:complete len:528 (-),score=89.27 TRINITY_DN1814_c1_g2_i1:1031-2614(-)
MSVDPAMSLHTRVSEGFNVVLDPVLLRTSVETTGQLFLMCGFIFLLMKFHILAPNTAQVLSKAAVNVYIPAFLFSKVATTVANRGGESLAIMATMPLFSLVLILLGLAMGALVCRILSWISPLKGSKHAANGELPSHHSSNSAVDTSPLLEEARGAEFSAEDNAQILAARKQKEGIIMAACAFSNCLSLPPVLLAGVLPPDDYNRASGYLALLLVMFSPLLFIVGRRILVPQTSVVKGVSRIGGESGADSKSTSSTDSAPPSWKSRFQAVISFIIASGFLNAPTIGTLAGLLVGVSPLWKLFEGRTDPDSGSEEMSWWMSLTKGLLHPVLQAALTFGQGYVPVAVAVLAASIGQRSISTPFPSPPKQEASALSKELSMGRREGDAPHESVHPHASHAHGPLHPVMEDQSSREEQVAQAVEGELDELAGGKAFWAVALVRNVAMPLVGIALVKAARHLRLIPDDPMAAIIVLAASATPPAQNLVLLAQLSGSTKLAGPVADLLLRMYLLAVIPLPLWMALFLSMVKAM